jgi:hypothetical protein
MSRSELPVPTENHNTRDRAHATHDVVTEVSSRAGISREAAKAEMERFRDVAEYETRKLFGQRSALRQPAEPLPARKKPRRRTAENDSAQSKTTRIQSPPRQHEEATIHKDGQQAEVHEEQA